VSSICLLVSFFLVFASIIAACTSGNITQGGETYLIIEQKCSRCHSPQHVYAKKRTEDEWKRLMHGMKMRGLVVTPAEEQEIMNVLKENLLLDN
jgi:hypothetical protein